MPPTPPFSSQAPSGHLPADPPAHAGHMPGASHALVLACSEHPRLGCRPRRRPACAGQTMVRLPTAETHPACPSGLSTPPTPSQPPVAGPCTCDLPKASGRCRRAVADPTMRKDRTVHGSSATAPDLRPAHLRPLGPPRCPHRRGTAPRPRGSLPQAMSLLRRHRRPLRQARPLLAVRTPGDCLAVRPLHRRRQPGRTILRQLHRQLRRSCDGPGPAVRRPTAH